MSHFSVLVISDVEPTDEVLAGIMQPWHEFECTGKDDQYVQDVDDTEELRKEYNNRTERRFVSPDGDHVCPYSDRFYRDPTDEEKKHFGPIAGTGSGNGMSWSSRDWGDGKGYRPKVHFLPEGWTEKEVPTKEIQSFRDFVADWTGRKVVVHGSEPDLKEHHKYGYILVDAAGEVIKSVDRTNPDRKWDYWRVGGRSRGKLQAKNQTAAVDAGVSWEWRDAQEIPEGYDICQVGNLDYQSMKAAAVDRRRKWALEVCDKANVGLDVLEVAATHMHEAEEKWRAIEGPKPRGQDYYNWLAEQGYAELSLLSRKNWGLPEPEKGQTIQEWIDAAPALSSFAVVKDGNWYQRGRMGWWGCVSEEDDCWDSKFTELIEGLRDDQWLAVLDCHI